MLRRRSNDHGLKYRNAGVIIKIEATTRLFGIVRPWPRFIAAVLHYKTEPGAGFLYCQRFQRKRKEERGDSGQNFPLTLTDLGKNSCPGSKCGQRQRCMCVKVSTGPGLPASACCCCFCSADLFSARMFRLQHPILRLERTELHPNTYIPLGSLKILLHSLLLLRIISS